MRAGVVALISDRADRIQSKGSYQEKRRAFHNDKGVNYPGRVTIFNVYVPNNRASKTNRTV